MNKKEFIAKLRQGLNGLPQSEIEERVIFYSEMIDDRIEEGLSEEDAVAAIGNVDEAVSQIRAEMIPLVQLKNEKKKQKRPMRAWEIVLLILGFPIWFPILIVAIALMFVFYVVLWTLLIVLWAAAFGSLVGCTVGNIAAGVIFIFTGDPVPGFAMVGIGMICAGASIFMFFICSAATKGVLMLTKGVASGIKKCFVKKEAA